MAYIGNIPAEKYVSLTTQHFSVTATASYTLSSSVTNENGIALFINNVRQQPGSSYAYTAAGTALTLSAATAATDTMYCVYLGKSVGTISPPDGSVNSAKIVDGSITNDDLAGSITSAKITSLDATKLTGTIAEARLATLDATKLTGTVPLAALGNAPATILDSPVITGTLSVLDSGTVTHTIANWSDDASYTITPTNCTAGAVNGSGQFVITHTSGTPSYTIKATTASLGLGDSAIVNKNITIQLTAPTLSSPADVGTAVDVIYTITSTDSNDDKLILDPGTANFTYQSESGPGTASKVGNTVECVGFGTGNPVVTIQFTAEATYSVTAKAVKIDGTYGTSANSSADSITIANSYTIDFLVIAGAGGGGGSTYGGGGGAGGYRNSYNSETSGRGSASETGRVTSVGDGQLDVTVGTGGAAGPGGTQGSKGLNSVFATYTSLGGGAGTDDNHTTHADKAGGCGGAPGRNASGAAGAGTADQGFDSGATTDTTNGSGGAGGGGAGAVGVNSASGNSGAGGAGLSSDISGSTVVRAGGGGGSAHYNYSTGGAGGTGGGGKGAEGSEGSASAVAGATNKGSGGGGGNYSSRLAAAGGKGVVILRMPTANFTSVCTGNVSGPNAASATSGSDTILIFNGDGSYTA